MVGGAKVWDGSHGTQDCRGFSGDVTSFIRVSPFH